MGSEVLKARPGLLCPRSFGIRFRILIKNQVISGFCTIPLGSLGFDESLIVWGCRCEVLEICLLRALPRVLGFRVEGYVRAYSSEGLRFPGFGVRPGLGTLRYGNTDTSGSC